MFLSLASFLTSWISISSETRNIEAIMNPYGYYYWYLVYQRKKPQKSIKDRIIH